MWLTAAAPSSRGTATQTRSQSVPWAACVSPCSHQQNCSSECRLTCAHMCKLCFRAMRSCAQLDYRNRSCACLNLVLAVVGVMYLEYSRAWAEALIYTWPSLPHSCRNRKQKGKKPHQTHSVAAAAAPLVPPRRLFLLGTPS